MATTDCVLSCVAMICLTIFGHSVLCFISDVLAERRFKR